MENLDRQYLDTIDYLHDTEVADLEAIISEKDREIGELNKKIDYLLKIIHLRGYDDETSPDSN